MTATIREVLQMNNNNVSGQTLTSSSSVASGDTFIVLQANDSSTGTSVSAATSTAGTLTQFGTDVVDGNGNGLVRILTCNASSGGSKTVSFPAAGGSDVYGVVLIITGTVTLEGFASASEGSSATSHTTPATASLTGAADLLVMAGLDNAGIVSTWNLTSSGLTQQSQVTTNFGAFVAGTATLTSSGVSPTYPVTTSSSVKVAMVTFGLDDGGATPTQQRWPQARIVAPSLAATFRASW